MIWTIFKTFFLLGCTSFGGPAAHLGYFRQHFVQRLEWVDEDQYAQWIAISQVMPGPGSSQVGFAIGCHQAGLTGGIAAFVGFTLPSVILMCLFALFGALFIDSLWFANVVSALKLMAVVIVADAALGMYRAFCTTLALKVAALIGGTFVLVWPFGLAGLYLVIGAVLLGALLPSRGKSEPTSQRKPALRQANVLLLLFIGMLLLSATVEASGILGMMAEFYQSGSFVFGGGHVVLPLINEFVSGDVSTTQVLTGYAVAQAVPGPMFTIATYLGAVAAPAGQGILWGGAATLAIFLPGLLLMRIGQSYWLSLSQHGRAQGAVKYVNAAVVGLLVATLVFPIIPASVTAYWQIPVIGVSFIWLQRFKPPIWQVITVFLLGAVTASFV